MCAAWREVGGRWEAEVGGGVLRCPALRAKRASSAGLVCGRLGPLIPRDARAQLGRDMTEGMERRIDKWSTRYTCVSTAPLNIKSMHNHLQSPITPIAAP